MKTRTVIMAFEIETDMTIKDLRANLRTGFGWCGHVKQIATNVVDATRPLRAIKSKRANKRKN